jgi:hypothetical protein
VPVSVCAGNLLVMECGFEHEHEHEHEQEHEYE